jgi:hypothetical protein
MYDHRAIAITCETIESDLPKRRQRFGLKLARLKSEAALKGTGQSSGLLWMIADACAGEVEDSADNLWRILHRCLTTTGVSPDAELATSLKRSLGELLTTYCISDPEGHFTQAAMQIQADAAVVAGTGFHERVIAVRRHVRAEVDLFVASLENRASSLRKPRAVFNTYAPVGSIQTGEHAQATISQALGIAGKELLQILEGIST